ncbi:hypothetical protein PVAG01_00570 [Phlyctema vagabunda]|uniref:Ribonucleases P/MRP subunit Pop8-like domain-containing protein n=1 Tax=Phlyctema vagabunda TaxID=108571 RepID=A0ABR4PUY9_9HELO
MAQMETIDLRSRDGDEDGDICMTNNTDIETSSDTKTKQNQAKGREITSKTIKAPPFSYIHLELITSSSYQEDLDDLTVRSHIAAALTRFLGLTGSAISVDLLKVDGQECWVRIPREDLSPVVAALGGWVGGTGDRNAGNSQGQVSWRIKGSGNWLSVLVNNKDTRKIWNA